MLVSVVIPVYNVRDFLEKCVTSVINQTYSELEIILVDDGSTDGSDDICNKLAVEDSRIEVIHKKNGGLSDARNVGMKSARGKYLFFLDSDDTINSMLIEKSVEVAESYKADIVYFDYRRLEPNGQIEVCNCRLPQMQPMSLESNPELLLSTISVCMKLFLREFLEKTEINFPLGYRYEDLGTMPKILHHAKRIIYLKEPLYDYQIREGSITTGTDSERNYQHRKAMLEGVLSYYKEHNKYEKYKSELEYLFIYNMYFLPAKEMLYSSKDLYNINKCRDYLEKNFHSFRKNRYIQNMDGKERLQFFLIEKKQYWLINVMSWLRKQRDCMRR